MAFKNLITFILICLIIASNCGENSGKSSPPLQQGNQARPIKPKSPEKKPSITTPPPVIVKTKQPVELPPPKDMTEGLTPKDRKSLWHLFGPNGINIEPAWQITQGSPDITMAVIDWEFLPSSAAFSDCIDKYHYLNFASEMSRGKDHGLAVSSLLSTCINNPLKLLGVNNISPVLWLELEGNASETDRFILAWALKLFDCKDKKVFNCHGPINAPVNIINLSFDVGHKEPEEFKRIQTDYLQLSYGARIQNSLIVAAAGNEGTNADKIIPHSLTGVISVGATTKDGKSWKDSNWGETVDIMAPGNALPVAVSATVKVGSANGTSFASPIVAGVVSLMKSVYPDLNWKTAIYFLQSTAVPMNCSAYCVGRKECKRDCCKNGVQVCTPGRVDAFRAVSAAKSASINGLPQVALVDAEPFFIELKPAGGGVFGKFILRNVGGGKGTYNLSSDNPHVKVNPSLIELGEKDAANDHKEISLTSGTKDPGWANIKIRSPQAGKTATYSDEIVVSASHIKPNFRFEE